MSYPPGPSSGGEYVDPISGQPGSYGQPSQPYGSATPPYGQPVQGQPQFGGSFGQNTTYTGGLYGSPDGKPPRNNRPLIIGAIAAVVLLAVGAGVWILVANSGDDTTASPPPVNAPPSSSESAPPSTDDSGTGTGTDGPAVVPAATPGWQGVYVPKEKIAYDVPKQAWKVATTDTLSGWGDAQGNPIFMMHGISEFHDGWCPADAGNNEAIAGVQRASGTSLDKAARGYVIMVGSAIQEKKPDPKLVDESAGKAVKVNGGKTPASVSTAMVPIKYDSTTPKSCRKAKTERVTAVAFDPQTTKADDGQDNLAVVIIVSDVGGKYEVSKADEAKIIASARPAAKKPS